MLLAACTLAFPEAAAQVSSAPPGGVNVNERVVYDGAAANQRPHLAPPESIQYTPPSMFIYTGSLDDVRELIQYFRTTAANLRSLRKLVISREKTVVLDVNGDGVEFPGLTYGSKALEELLRELGVIFTPQNLHNPNATPTGVKEFDLSGRWTWGHDRVM